MGNAGGRAEEYILTLSSRGRLESSLFKHQKLAPSGAYILIRAAFPFVGLVVSAHHVHVVCQMRARCWDGNASTYWRNPANSPACELCVLLPDPMLFLPKLELLKCCRPAVISQIILWLQFSDKKGRLTSLAERILLLL